MVWPKITKNKAIILILIVGSLLRLFALDKIPVSLFGDELDVGYQAYSLLKTGKDYSGNFLPLQPQSLFEYRTPLFIYSSIPFVAIFGITPIGLRLLPALMGILNIFLLFIFVKNINNENKKVFGLKFEEISALILALNPWHIQYSRAAFEVTEVLTLILFGLIFFAKSLSNKGKHVWLSALFFLLTPWTYNTPKLFTPLFLISLTVIYFSELKKVKIKEWILVILVGLVLGVPLFINTLSGQGSARFSSISIFNDPVLEKTISETRAFDDKESRYFHNKFTYFGSKFFENYLRSFSPEFLFLYGDTNPRHSIHGQGMFYAIDAVILLVGLALFFAKFENKKMKLVMIAWLLLGALPSALTIDGASHATRLILVLIPLAILMAYGLVHSSKVVKVIYFPVLLVCFIFFLHNLWIHNSINSQKWWHYGWSEAVSYIKEHESEYEHVLITEKDEPPQIFFLANYSFNPKDWQEQRTGKFYFKSFDIPNIYELGSKIDTKTLYLASQSEVKVDLLHEPERVPSDLNLLHTVVYPSGDPAFYLFSKK